MRPERKSSKNKQIPAGIPETFFGSSLSFFFFSPLGIRKTAWRAEAQRVREGWRGGEERGEWGGGIWRVSGQRYLIDGLFKQTATHTPPCGTVPRSPRLQHGACSAGRNTKGEPGGESDGRGNTYLDRISKPPPQFFFLPFFFSHLTT